MIPFLSPFLPKPHPCLCILLKYNK